MTTTPAQIPIPTPIPTPTQAPVAGPAQPARLLGIVVALVVTDPSSWASRPLPDLVVPAFAALAAWFAATPLTARPVALGFRWHTRLSRHRNTAFAVLCVLLAAVYQPPTWLAACDTALLLSYLLAVDAAAAGPPAVRLLRRPLVLLCAYGASAVALCAALLPVAPTGSWARLLASVALVGAAGAVIAALTARRRTP